jgi:hypothetical protein
MLVEPVAVKAPAGVNDDANAGPDIAVHATAAMSAPIFLMIILSRLSFLVRVPGVTFPTDRRGGFEAGGDRSGGNLVRFD